MKRKRFTEEQIIGAIAESLGAVGVIASLVYLATQIRQSREQMGQNTRALRAGTYQQYSDGMHAKVNGPLVAPGMARIISSGMAGFDRLDDEDAFQFTFWIDGVMRGLDNAYYQCRMGMLDDERWEIHRADVIELFENPGVVKWWRSTRLRRSRFSPEFVTLVEEILGEEPDRADR